LIYRHSLTCVSSHRKLGLGIFIGRFFGPLRAAVPLIAGMLEMPYWVFQLANVASAFLWAWVLLVFGDVGFGVIKWFTGDLL
jgi:membrane protein DedA with SNARE-associated domain